MGEVAGGAAEARGQKRGGDIVAVMPLRWCECAHVVLISWGTDLAATLPRDGQPRFHWTTRATEHSVRRT